jgi:cellulose synthase/poly-beta-1,6-N-acetylglucosamine synthase-like glycosyltransferase
LVNQDYPKKEVIVINDASTDGTLKILKQYQKKKLIRLINLKVNVGKKRALAKGMLIAKGDIFGFTDSDSIIEKTAISRLVKVFAHHPEIGAVSGHCRALNGDKNLLTKVQDSWYEGQFSIRKAFESTFGAVTCVSGPLAVFRKESIFNYIPAWEADMFFGQEFKFATDRTLTGFVLGGKYIGEKLKKKHAGSPFVKRVDYPCKDWQIVYSKSARSWTVVPDNMKSFIKQQVRWKKSFIRNIFFTGVFFWHKPLIPAINYYAHVLFVLVGPFIAFRHLVYLPLSGNWLSAISYVVGIAYVGFMFGLAYKLENPESNKWMYRPLMSLMSTLVLSWLIFYSAVTIRKMVWARG